MNTSPDLFITAVKMLLALGATIGILLLAFKFTRGMIADRVGKPGPGMVKVLSSTYIGVKKSISLVEVPGAILVLGISGEAISLLSKIEDPETLEAIRNPVRTDSAKFTSAFGFAQKIMHEFSASRGHFRKNRKYEDNNLPNYGNTYDGNQRGQ